ncbi:MAG TPA: glycosyltransferase family 2 protein [Isosphaeraceae bacterium]|jgi:glycosyltransferase involved in cell wall biosynthesis|nr:glycosyltransferase family 2 protein [Isosphaeraceae bacterium]
MIVTIVIPTHNRGAKLSATLARLLANDADGFDEVEIVVVDDGSTVPVGPLVDGFRSLPPFTLRCVRLAPNVGPAGARNAGFRAACGEVVLFIDDDILAPPDLIRRHVEAHRVRPGSVVCGSWRLVAPEPMTPLYRYIDSLGFDGAAGSTEEFVPVATVSSGHISVERAMFPPEEGVYRDNLSVPAAEEYELSLRLRNRGIPVLLAHRIVALHDHPVTLDNMCRQAFKHAMGCAEAAVKCPATLELQDVRNIMAANRPILRRDTLVLICKKAVKRLLAMRRPRSVLLRVTQHIERLTPRAQLCAPFYRAVLGLHFFAGVREGLEVFSEGIGVPGC